VWLREETEGSDGINVLGSPPSPFQSASQVEFGSRDSGDTNGTDGAFQAGF